LQVFRSLQQKQVINFIKKGSIGIIPTDTVYGLVCSASNQAAVEKLYRLKERDEKPGTIIAASVDQLIKLGIKPRYLKAVESFWPNPLSVIIPLDESLSYLHLGLQAQPFRVVADKDVSKLLRITGPLLTSSANKPGLVPVFTIDQAEAYFGEKVDFYVDGGNLKDRKASTIIRIVDDAIEIIRAGAVNIDETGKLN
jgi:L-threonylcarbamoyladenylate synthase